MALSNDKNENIPVTNSAPPKASKDVFDVGTFFPYLVRLYYSAVSEAVSRAYIGKFGLSVSEWRTMAVLGGHQVMSASEIVTRSSLDKVTISRAVKTLHGRGYIKRDVDGDDRRRAVLRLSDEGRRVFYQIVPLVEDMAEKCLEGLSAAERETLISLMERVGANAQELNKEK